MPCFSCFPLRTIWCGFSISGERGLREPAVVTKVSLLGSTGSIGTQAVDVIRCDRDRFDVVALGRVASVKTLAEQAWELRPEVVAVGDPSCAAELEAAVPKGTEVCERSRGPGRAGSARGRRGQRRCGLCRSARHLGGAAVGSSPRPRQQGIAHRRGPRCAPGARHARGRDRPGRLRAQRPPPVPASRPVP